MAKTQAAKARQAKRIAKIVAGVNSTCLRRVEYDGNERLLDLEFRDSGAVYRYFDPTVKDARGLINAASVGRYFNRKIRNNFEYERIRARRPRRKAKKTR